MPTAELPPQDPGGTPFQAFRIDRTGLYLAFWSRGMDSPIPPSLFLGKRMRDAVPDLAVWGMPLLERALETGELQAHEYTMLLPDGYHTFEALFLRSTADEIVAIVRDTTDQRKTDARLREAEAKYRAFHEQSMFGIFIVEDRRLTYMNPKLAAIFGMDSADVPDEGLPITILDDPDHPAIDAFLSELEHKGPGEAPSSAQRTFHTRRKDGTKILVDIFGTDVSYSGKPATIGVVVDVTEARRAEEERARLADEMMRMQERMVVELSTPLIPVSDELLVMPLIGSVDERRAQQVMERLLHGVASHRAKAVIIDVTGVSSMTAQTASALARCAQAVRLLGARALMTGVRADVAQALITIGVDLAGIVTLGTLKAGIAYAMGRRW